jgi:hypothetical protein
VKANDRGWYKLRGDDLYGCNLVVSLARILLGSQLIRQYGSRSSM